MIRRTAAVAALLSAGSLSLALWARAPVDPVDPVDPVVRIMVDAGADRHPISPLIYGASFATPAAARDLGLAFDRSGGNSASLYDWRTEARGAGRDWYFESLPIAADEPAQYGARFVEAARAGGATPALTVPMMRWAATIAPGGGKQAAFSTIRYGAQADVDTAGLPTAGNGVRRDGSLVTGNDPHDAAHPVDLVDRQAWLRSLVARFGSAARGGVRFYALDNEPTRWHDIHRDVHPVGLHAAEQARLTIDTARAVKAIDPGALVMAPEAWGWGGYRHSGFDQQQGDARGYGRPLPDRLAQTGGMDLLPWLLTQWKAAGHPVDIVSVHFYPQGGEYRADGRDDVSPAMQRRRNRSTRALWDPAYRDESWIGEPVALIPRLRGWIARYYEPHTPIAITEYGWGGDAHMNGATAQADVLGILGRENVALAARWLTPAAGSPVYLAMKLYRNADGHGRGFGETSVAARVPDPDTVSAFAAVRAKDGALTVMAINKEADRAMPLSLALARFARAGTVRGFRLVDRRLVALAPARYAAATMSTLLPAQSVTLFEVIPDAR